MQEDKEIIVEKMQRALKTIRLIMGFSAQELAEYIGVARQTVNNLETGKTQLSEVQVIALLAIADRRLKKDSAELHSVKVLLGFDTLSKNYNFTESDLLLNIWFRVIGLECKFEHNSLFATTDLYEELSDKVIFVFLDFLMQPQAQGIIEDIIPHLLQKGNTLIIPRVHVVALLKESEMRRDTSEQAQTVVQLVVNLKNKNLIQIRGREDDSFRNDIELFEYILSRYAEQNQLAIFTQNPRIANIVVQKQQKSCVLYRINDTTMGLEKVIYDTTYAANSSLRMILESIDQDLWL